MTYYRHALIKCERCLRDFHERSKYWDINYLKWLKVMVDFEMDCRLGNKTFARDIEDFHNKSVCVGSNDPHWENMQ